jgi:hypothetical protein
MRPHSGVHGRARGTTSSCRRAMSTRQRVDCTALTLAWFDEAYVDSRGTGAALSLNVCKFNAYGDFVVSLDLHSRVQTPFGLDDVHP